MMGNAGVRDELCCFVLALMNRLDDVSVNQGQVDIKDTGKHRVWGSFAHSFYLWKKAER